MKVLLTGGNGFLATHCLEALLAHGHSVVFTARSQEKAQLVMRPYLGRNLSYVIVKDLAEDGAFDYALKSEPPFDAVLHTASPFHYNVQDNKRDMLDPAIKGTTEVLRGVQKAAPSVTRVVITSSFAAMANVGSHPQVYNEDVWNPMTMEEALATKDPQVAYRASKKFAELAAWDFVEKEKPNFSLTVLCPPLVLGPPVSFLRSLDELNTSNQKLLKMMRGVDLSGPQGSPMWVDVRDLAEAHVRAIERPQAAGKRIFICAGRSTDAEIGRIIENSLPDLKGKVSSPLSDKLPPYDIDNSRSKEILGMEYRSLEDCISAAVLGIREHEMRGMRHEA